MKKKRCTEEQIYKILKESDSEYNESCSVTISVTQKFTE